MTRPGLTAGTRDGFINIKDMYNYVNLSKKFLEYGHQNRATKTMIENMSTTRVCVCVCVCVCVRLCVCVCNIDPTYAYILYAYLLACIRVT